MAKKSRAIIEAIFENTLRIIIPILVFSFLFPIPEQRVSIRLQLAEAQMTQLKQASRPQPSPVQIVLGDPSINARSILVYDPESNLNLYQKNADQQLPIASLTKLMTAIVAIKNSAFNQAITITDSDHVSIEPVLHLRTGDKIMPIDLVKAMLVGSANDAAVALANHFPNYDAFVAAMNQQAQTLGMTETHFSTPIGFDQPGNYSTAADLKKLVNFAVKNLPYGQIWQNTNYSFASASGNQYKIQNSNMLVFKYPNIKSIKTGFTEQAQGNMIVLANNSQGNQVITMILGSSQREKDTLSMVDYVFKKFSWND